jgi:hypothetical protein
MSSIHRAPVMRAAVIGPTLSVTQTRPGTRARGSWGPGLVAVREVLPIAHATQSDGAGLPEKAAASLVLLMVSRRR